VIGGLGESKVSGTFFGQVPFFGGQRVKKVPDTFSLTPLYLTGISCFLTPVVAPSEKGTSEKGTGIASQASKKT
jgi:hypothetical protein